MCGRFGTGWGRGIELQGIGCVCLWRVVVLAVEVAVVLMGVRVVVVVEVAVGLWSCLSCWWWCGWRWW